MKNIVLLVLLLGAIAAVYFYGVPAWGKIMEHRAKIAEVESLQEKHEEVREAKEELIRRFTSISDADQERLDLLLPDSVDHESLYVYFVDLFGRARVTPDRIVITPEPPPVADPASELPPQFVRKTISVEFSVEGSYENIRSLIELLERNIRLTDVSMINFTSVEDNIYTVTIRGTMYYGRE